MTTALLTKDLTHTTARFQVKAAAKDTRQFSGLLATWDLDYGGDKIVPGAFARTLKRWKTLGYKIPLVDQHRYDSVRKVIGKLLDATETDEGLETTWQVVNSAEGDEYLARLKDDMIDGLSIGYEAIDAQPPSPAERKAGVKRVLADIELNEGSLVIWGMNPNAIIDTASVKSISGSLAGLRRETLTDDDRKTLRQIASQCGALLRPLTAGEEKSEPPVEEEREDAEQPQAPPGDPADAPKAATMSAEETAALRQELLAFQIRQTLHA